GREQLTKKLDYLERLTDDVLSKTAAGYTIDDINVQLFPEPSPLVQISKRDYDSRHMISSILREVYEQLR
ncbi:MAG: MBL fold metallo-hydrolase, partial [Exiguobacterium marinum]